MKKVIAAFVMIPLAFCANAQTDTAMLLKEVQVTSTRFDQFNSGSKVQQADSFIMQEGRYANLAELLGAQSQVFVKTYGQGSIATTSFRGAAAAHTAVLWNGFNLQSPMHGEFDFSLMPVYLIDEVKVQYGGNGALFGSGAIGGAVHLNNSPAFGKGWTTGIMAQAGSFGHMAYGAKLEYGSARYTGATRFYTQQEENDFPFTNTALYGTPEVKQTNAQLKQSAVLSSHKLQLSKRNAIQLHFWYQLTDRNIPPSMTRLNNLAFQIDESYRGSAEYRHVRTRATYILRQAIFDELLNYDDPDAYIVGRNRAQSYISEGELKYQLRPKWQFNVGLNNTFTKANSDGYNGSVSMNRTALFYSLKGTEVIKKVSFTASIRHEVVDQEPVPVCPSLGVDWMITRVLKLSAVASSSYRVPTFNNRYWKPGGNPDILPERGLGEELTLRYARVLKKLTFDFAATGFNRKVNNWIIWLPKDGYWTPQNIKTVWSRGGELNLKGVFSLKHWSFMTTNQFNYVLSTNEEVSGPNDGSLNRQLIYVPRITQQHEFRIMYRKVFFAYNHTYAGIRYTTSDHSAWLNPYQIGNMILGGSAKLYGTDFTLHFKAGNIWNEVYQAMEWRPMPLVNYMLTLIIQLNIKPQNKP